MIGRKENDEAELELKMCRDINNMDPAVQDRFKALHALCSKVNDLNNEESQAIYELELKYEKLYQQVYAKRAALLKGDFFSQDEELILKFDERAQIFQDKVAFPDVECAICDVKDI